MEDSDEPQAKKPKLSEPEDTVGVEEKPESSQKEWLPVSAESLMNIKSESSKSQSTNSEITDDTETVVEAEISDTVCEDTVSVTQKTESDNVDKPDSELCEDQEVNNGENVESEDSVKTEEIEPVEKHHVKETDVGILEYISPFAGFQGVIKQRYSDFLVNEISVDGKVVHLTNTDIPKEPVQPMPVREYKIPPGLLSEEEIIKLKELQQSSRGEQKSVLISVGEDREYRTKIHNAIAKGFPGLDSSTVTKFHEKFIEATLKNDKGRGNGLHNWPKGRGNYCKFSFYKEAQDTVNAVGILSNKLRLKHGVFQYAGTKDKRSKSTQEVTAYRVAAEKLIEANRFMRNIVCGNFSYTDSKLSLGQLKGNKFTIVLRSVSGTEEQIAAGMKSLNDIGFINYYGMQRFGTFSIPTHHIGRALLSSNWKEAVELILKPRHGEGITITQVRERWWRTRDSKEAATKMPKNSHIERSLLLSLAKNPNNYMGAIQKITRSSRMMYVHAYQSYIWNCVVSHRIKQFGIKPVCGDLVIPHKQYIQTEDTEAENVEEKKESTDKQTPIMIDESNIDTYTIYDVVLPKPGYDVIYPGNDLELLYKDMMEQDDLDYQNMKTKYKDYSLSGDYRHIVAKPEDVDYKLFKYNDVNIPLALSDYDRMKGEPEPESIEDGANLALRIEMTLPTSSYATMALRELLKIDTSSNFQASLNST
ncbi:multisubstrate pseudouridine synthase 7 [Mactra antiquata]